MRKSTKIALAVGICLLGIGTLTSCTQNFCSTKDKANILYAYDPGVTAYFDVSELDPDLENEKDTSGNDYYRELTYDTPLEFTNVEGKTVTYTFKNVWYNADLYGDVSEYLEELIEDAVEDGVLLPESEYFETLDKVVLYHAIEKAVEEDAMDEILELYGCSNNEISAAAIRDEDGILDKYGYIKFADSFTDAEKEDDFVLWNNWYIYNEEVRQYLPYDIYPTSDYLEYYVSTLNSEVGNYRSCIAIYEGKYGYYGYGGRSVTIEKKTWKYAWQEGFLEGLLVYPISAFVDVLTQGFFNAGLSMESGVAQILAILIVTIVVRLVVMAIMFWPNLSQQKMTALQPEMAAIQQKYPNSKTNKRDRELLGMEQQKLYKKNHVNPFVSLIVMVIQFPIFLCVWGALQGSAVLSTGTFLGLKLSDTISSAMFTGAMWTSAGGFGAVTALVIFLLMAAAQVMQMLMPQLLQRRRTKKVAKLGNNPSAKSNNNRMRIFQWVMLAIIIIMGFFLVSAMAVYWFIGAIMGMLQTFLMDYISKRQIRKARYESQNKYVRTNLKTSGTSNGKVKKKTKVKK